MALTNNNLEIIKALAENDMAKAKRAAIASLTEDNTKKNAWAVNYYKKLLVGNASLLMSSLPSEMQTFLVGTEPAGFDEHRYYVRPADQTIVDDIIKMKRISEELSHLKISYKNTALLYGASGTGKTELGKYIAFKLNLPFFYISFSTMIDSHMGSTAKNIHKVFDFCSSVPCVLMLDEVDCITTKRGSGSGEVKGEIERTTISVMQELDKLPNHVVLIAATNRLDMIDDALLRRFYIRHEVENMTKDDLSQLGNQFLVATDTKEFVDDDLLRDLVNKSMNPGDLMPMLIRKIGKNLYEAKKDEILAKEKEEDGIVSNVWEVSYTWKMNVTAENEADAISIARSSSYSCKKDEKYEAKQAEWIGPDKNEEKTMCGRK